MAENDGLIRPRFEVHCRRCEHPNLGLAADTMMKAVRELEREGWKMVKKRWHCPECAELLV